MQKKKKCHNLFLLLNVELVNAKVKVFEKVDEDLPTKVLCLETELAQVKNKNLNIERTEGLRKLKKVDTNKLKRRIKLKPVNNFPN